jgi:hypothetical protein
VALTLDEARLLRGDYFNAMRALASGKSYTIGTRTLERADEKFVAEKFAEYDRIVTALEAGRNDGVNIVRIMPRDL